MREDFEIGDHKITVTARQMHVSLQDEKIKKFKYAIDDLIDSLGNKDLDLFQTMENQQIIDTMTGLISAQNSVNGGDLKLEETFQNLISGQS